MTRSGIERFVAQGSAFAGKRLALISAPSAVDGTLRASIDLLHERFRLALLLAPEHGIRGDIQAGGLVQDCVDEKTGVPVRSLYSGDNRPQSGSLEEVDAVVFDLQDVGCRYYTFLSTMRLMMEECARRNKPFVVLDRVNPIGGRMEGNLLDLRFSSFVGIASIPQRHGLTVGELAQLFNEEDALGCALTVVPVENWRRTQYFDETGLLWVNPSPNIPSVDAALLYPGTCLFEGTNLSEGRGTTKPFEMVGAPWLPAEQLAQAMNAKRLPGVLFRPAYFTPTFSKHQGSLCKGVQVHITDRDAVQPVLVGLHLLREAHAMSGERFVWVPPNKEKAEFFIDLLAGTDTLRKTLDVEAYWDVCQNDSALFAKTAQPYLLYR